MTLSYQITATIRTRRQIVAKTQRSWRRWKKRQRYMVESTQVWFYVPLGT